MMRLPIYQVDAFTARLFGGNPAAVVPLAEWLPDATMQAIAQENNLAETAFFVPTGDRYHLRWFTPELEIDLCGHATLATAHVIFEKLAPERQSVAFDTRSGELTVARSGGLLSMDFPSRPPTPLADDPALAAALGARPRETWTSRDCLCLLENEAAVRDLKPDMTALEKLPYFAIIVTAAGESADFVSRFFAPGAGVPEDPVTGSAHSTLIPFWAARLGRTKMRALQLSRRGGELFCEFQGNRVQIAGRAVLYLEGEIAV